METCQSSTKAWPTIRDQLLRGMYRPKPVRRVTIPKPDGGERELGIPTVTDRLIQQALLRVLQPILDPTFSEQRHHMVNDVARLGQIGETSGSA